MIWRALVYSRTKGNGCPDCSRESQTSFPEQAIHFYLKHIFCDAINRYKYNNKLEIDIFIPSLKLGIEYDGIYYHQNKRKFDSRKERHLLDEGISLLRIKEVDKNIKKCYQKNKIIYCSKKYTECQLNEVIRLCFIFIFESIAKKHYTVDIDVKRDKYKIYDLYIMGEKENSLLGKYPKLSKQWHPTKNLSIKPDMVKPNTNKKFWWQCEKGHEWQANVNSRTRGVGCPYCSGKRACVDNCLQTLNPNVAKEWHPTKNGNLTPSNVTIGSGKKVWWQCEKGHEWITTIKSRCEGSGCPHCYNIKRNKDKNKVPNVA